MSALSDKQFYIVAGAVVVGGLYLRWKGKKLLNAFNPASDQNVIYKGVQETVGEDRLEYVTNSFFAPISLLNPWASDAEKTYAKRILGIKK